jgi:hypothetical protein
VLVLGAPALAAAPEAPELTVAAPVKATEATFLGILSPKATEPNEGGSYKFLYKASKTECAGGSETAPGLSLGSAHEELPGEPVSSLSANTEYTVCLSITNLKSETTVSPPVTFKTALPPEQPAGEEAVEIKATTATVKGVLNPKAKGDAGTYEFLYRVSTTECEGESRAPEPAGAALGAAKEAVSTKLAGLQPNAKYTFCLLASDAAGETSIGTPVHFTTPVAAPSILGESSPNLKASEARLEGVVNPNNEPTECHFQYGEATVSEREVPCEPTLLGGFGGQGVGVTIGGLNSKTIYHWRIVAKNGTGETTGGEEALTTAVPPETPGGEEAKETTATTVTLVGVLNPKGPGEAGGSYEFLYKASATECQGGPTTPTTPSAGATPEPVSAPLTGLVPNTQYTFCLLARNGVGETAVGAPATFTTAVVPPTVEGEAFSHVGSASVDFSAGIDDFGLSGTYHYEYGTTTSYGSSTPVVDLGTVNGVVTAPATLSGLQSNTTYHFRAVATDEAGTTPGADVTVRTLATASASLPDGRVFEMVTPVDNHGADVEIPFHNHVTLNPGPGIAGQVSFLPFQAAANGEAVTYAAGPTTGGAGSNNEYLATRSPVGGWTQVNVEPERLPKYVAFSPDLAVGILESQEPLAEGAPAENYGYATSPGSGSYQPLTAISGESGDFARNGYSGGNAGTGTVPSFSHVLAYGPNGLIDATGGRQIVVNVLPNGKAAPNAIFGAPQAFNTDTEEVPVLDHVISADGSRIFWTDQSTGGLYIRENDTRPQSPLNEAGECIVATDACTVQVDASSSHGALWWTSSGDGSKDFFTDCGRLTPDATAVFTEGCGIARFGRLSGSDLYQYDANSGKLTDLTVDHNASDPLGANVQGVVGSSQDGSYLYFVATGNLAAGASPGEPNLYLLHEGVTTLVTVLSFADEGYEEQDGAGIGPWEQSLADRSAQVAPDGRSLVFQAGGNVYHWEVEHGGPLVCVTCSPSVEVSSPEAPSPVSVQGGDLPVAFVPTNSTHQQRWISEDGSKVFFESQTALVPQDVYGGVQNVYEWERGGSGSCHDSPGCTYLLSGGMSTSWSSLLDASGSGNDVFIITRAQLTAQAENDLFKVFDARVGGSPAASSECSGSGCQGVPPAPPIFATPSSATFSGAGNYPPSPPQLGESAGQMRAKQLAKALKLCRKKHNRRKRTLCERNARKRFGPAKSARTSTRPAPAANNRRAGR